MIIVKISGGLGNQMFQYAAGIRAAIVAKDVLKLDISYYHHQPVGETKRQYELSIFNIPENFASQPEIKKLKENRSNILEKVLKDRFPIVTKLVVSSNKKYFKENSLLHFEDRILKIEGDAYLDGWWQSEKYFSDIDSIIRRIYRFKQKPLTHNQKLFQEITNCNSLLIHVRLGDYLTFSNYFVSCGQHYYQKGIEIIAQRRKIDKIYFLVEDPSWIKKNITTKIPITNIISGLTPRDWEDYLVLMAQGKHQIIANSNFSWWGAWLNSNKEKIVVAPKHWFKDSSVDTSDRLPSSWIKI